MIVAGMELYRPVCRECFINNNPDKLMKRPEVYQPVSLQEHGLPSLALQG